MLNYIKWLLSNYKYLQWVKKNKIPLWGTKLPSQTYFKYIPEETFGGKKVLNVGCGTAVYKTPNVTNIDLLPHEGINLVWDLSKMPLPLESNSFDFIIANHVLEHIPNWFVLFEELCRVLKPGGMIEVWVPPVSSDSALTYRDHINYIGVESFSGTGAMRRGGTNLLASQQDNKKTPLADVDMVWRGHRTIFVWWLLWTPPWVAEWCVEHLRNTASEIGFKFVKRATELCK